MCSHFLGCAVSRVFKVGVGGISGSTGSPSGRKTGISTSPGGVSWREVGNNYLGSPANSAHSVGKFVGGGKRDVSFG